MTNSFCRTLLKQTSVFILFKYREIVDSRLDYRITSNRESGFDHYDVALEPLQPHLNAIIIEFKVQDLDDEKSLQDTVK